MRVEVPKFATQKDLFSYLKANKSDIVKKKCAMPIKAESFSHVVTHDGKISKVKSIKANKVATSNEVDEVGELSVTVIANTAYWCDSQMDVLLPDCWKKTIKERGVQGKDMIYHLKDHEQETGGIVGYPTNIYSKEFTLQDLGINKLGATQCLLMDSVVKEELDDKVFQLYWDKKIKQHSIGMQYISLDLCINDPQSADEYYQRWVKYSPLVINTEAIIGGYFWVVSEIKLFEISAVLFGSNEITPTLEPSDDTQKEEPLESTLKEGEILEQIKKTNFFRDSEKESVEFIKSKQFFNN